MPKVTMDISDDAIARIRKEQSKRRLREGGHCSYGRIVNDITKLQLEDADELRNGSAAKRRASRAGKLATSVAS